MKWHRTIRKTGFSASVNLPNQLLRELGMAAGEVLEIEWSQDSAIVVLRPVPKLRLPAIPADEAGRTAHLPSTPPKPGYDSSALSP